MRETLDDLIKFGSFTKRSRRAEAPFPLRAESAYPRANGPLMPCEHGFSANDAFGGANPRRLSDDRALKDVSLRRAGYRSERPNVAVSDFGPI